MTQGLPIISGRDAVRALSRAGFELRPGRGKGSHMLMHRRDPFAMITIPDHRELDRGTLRSIIRQAGLTVNQFVELLK